jgi:hypothetical protein
VLNTQPASNVTINLASSDTTEGTVAASITFTPSNWNVPQVVTVTGVNDLAVDGDVAYTITTTVRAGSDPNYVSLNPADVSVTNRDNDPEFPNVALSITGSPLQEAGGVATITATLSAVSPTDTTVNLAFAGTATLTDDYTRSGTTIVIPAGQLSASITVTGVQDTADEADETIVVDIDSVTNGIEASPQQVTATIADAHLGAAVLSTVVNGGAAQRSMLTSLVVTFSEAIDVAGILPGAFSVVKHGGAAVGTVNVAWSAGNTVATITWSGAGTTAGSLNDGNYSLVIDHTKLTDAAFNALDGDVATPGAQDYVFGASQSDKFFRQFGDVNGDRKVNGADYAAFTNAWLSAVGNSNWNSAFDYNNDGKVNGSDYAAFTNRWLMTLGWV